MGGTRETQNKLMKEELLKILKDALEGQRDKERRLYRQLSAKEDRTIKLLEDLVEAIDY